MALMLYLDDAMKVLLQNDYIDIGYIDNDGGSQIVRNELEQKCYLREPVDIVLCKDCKHRPELKLYSDRQGNYTAVEFPDGSKCPCQCEDYFYSWYPKDDWFCANGERREAE